LKAKFLEEIRLDIPANFNTIKYLLQSSNFEIVFHENNRGDLKIHYHSQARTTRVFIFNSIPSRWRPSFVLFCINV